MTACAIFSKIFSEILLAVHLQVGQSLLLQLLYVIVKRSSC